MAGKTHRVAMYVRVSTQEQSFELQKHEIEAAVKERGWILTHVYEEKASGTTANRAALKTMLCDSKLNLFDVIVVWKMDRLFRSLKDLIFTLHDLSPYVEFVSLRDNLDLTTSSGRLMMHMLGAFAEFEASLIRTRVKAGLELAKAKGIKLGRPRQFDAAKAYEMSKDGKSLSQIGQTLGVSRTAISKSLKKIRNNAA